MFDVKFLFILFSTCLIAKKLVAFDPTLNMKIKPILNEILVIKEKRRGTLSINQMKSLKEQTVQNADSNQIVPLLNLGEEIKLDQYFQIGEEDLEKWNKLMLTKIPYWNVEISEIKQYCGMIISKYGNSKIGKLKFIFWLFM